MPRHQEVKCRRLVCEKIENHAGGAPTIAGLTATAAELNIMSGVTATAAEINAVADQSTAYVALADAATAAISAANSKKLHIIPELTDSCTFTLPAAAAGLDYTFISKGVAAEAQDWIFDTGSDTNFFLGGLVVHDSDGDLTALEVPNGSSNSIMTVKTPEPGSTIRFICDGTNWILSGTAMTATNDGVTWADQA